MVVDWFEKLLRAFPWTEVCKACGTSAAPLDQLRRSISECQLVCAIVTIRDGASPQWISTEIGYALALDKPVCAFVEEGINDLGIIPHGFEYKLFERHALGASAPDYIKYIFGARSRAQDKAGKTRSELIVTIEYLQKLLTQTVDANNRNFDENPGDT